MEENAYLVLGCFGRSEDGFISCPSVENRILKIDESLNNSDKIMDYFESLKLFDRPLLDLNSIRHLVYNLQDRYDQVIRKLWTEHKYHLIEKFVHEHKQCGLYAKLIVVMDIMDNDKVIKEERSFVNGIPEKILYGSKLVKFKAQ